MLGPKALSYPRDGAANIVKDGTPQNAPWASRAIRASRAAGRSLPGREDEVANVSRGALCGRATSDNFESQRPRIAAGPWSRTLSEVATSGSAIRKGRVDCRQPYRTQKIKAITQQDWID
jgi:hypothetical protein